MTTPVPTPDFPAAAARKKPLWRRILKWMVRVVVVLLVLGIAAYALTYYWTAATINTEVARIRAAGEPLTFADLDALIPKVDRAQDAGPFYAAAAELVNVDYEADDAHYHMFFGQQFPPTPPPDEALAWAHRGIDQNRLALELVDRGSALPGCNSDIQLQYGLSVALPHLGRQRALFNAISLRTRVLALEDRGEDAVQSLISSLGLLRTLDRQPVLIDGLVQIAMVTRGCQDAAFVLDRSHPTEGALQQLDAGLRQPHLISPRKMFMAERVFYLEIMRRVIGGNSGTDPADDSEPLLPEREVWSHLGITGRVMVARSLPFYARYIDAASGDFPAIMTATQHVADSATSLLDKLNAPSLSKAIFTYARSLALDRSTLIAVQIERFRRAHNGQLPGSLAQLPEAGKLPIDPFTGKPLVYVKVADGYCVFSAGRGNPDDDSRNIDREQDPIGWSERWGVHIRVSAP